MPGLLTQDDRGRVWGVYPHALPVLFHFSLALPRAFKISPLAREELLGIYEFGNIAYRTPSLLIPSENDVVLQVNITSGKAELLPVPPQSGLISHVGDHGACTTLVSEFGTVTRLNHHVHSVVRDEFRVVRDVDASATRIVVLSDDGTDFGAIDGEAVRWQFDPDLIANLCCIYEETCWFLVEDSGGLAVRSEIGDSTQIALDYRLARGFLVHAGGFIIYTIEDESPVIRFFRHDGTEEERLGDDPFTHLLRERS